MMDFTPYTTLRVGLTDPQWDAIKDLFDCRRKRKHDLRDIVDGILYVLHSDDNWRMLPESFGPWQTVYYYYDKWRKSGLWFQLVQRLPDDIRSRLIEDARPALSLVDLYVPQAPVYNAQPGHSVSKAQPTIPSYTHRLTWFKEWASQARESQAA